MTNRQENSNQYLNGGYVDEFGIIYNGSDGTESTLVLDQSDSRFLNSGEQALTNFTGRSNISGLKRISPINLQNENYSNQNNIPSNSTYLDGRNGRTDRSIINDRNIINNNGRSNISIPLSDSRSRNNIIDRQNINSKSKLNSIPRGRLVNNFTGSYRSIDDSLLNNSQLSNREFDDNNRLSDISRRLNGSNGDNIEYRTFFINDIINNEEIIRIMHNNVRNIRQYIQSLSISNNDTLLIEALLQEKMLKYLYMIDLLTDINELNQNKIL